MNNITVNMENLSDKERETLTKLIEKANKVESNVWKPEMKTNYYIVSDGGGIYAPTWLGNGFDEGAYLIGNCFRTKEETEFALERLKVITEPQRYADEHNGEIDWNDIRPKFYIFYDCDCGGKIGVDYLCSHKCNDIYFSSEKPAINVSTLFISTKNAIKPQFDEN